VGAASDAIVTYDADANVVLINAAACRMFGVALEQAMGSAALALLGEGLAAELAGVGRRPHAAKCVFVPRDDGSRLAVEISASSVGEGRGRLTTVILRDVSDRERLEAESRSRIEAQAASRTKSLMMAYIAHEMGNPLNGLLGFAELMSADAAHPLPAEQATRLKYIVSSGQNLRHLMRDVMDLGSFESGRLAIDLQPLDTGACVDLALAAVAAVAGQADVALIGGAAASTFRVLGDSGRLQQCLVNLLTNAIKYNRPGGWARLDVTGDARKVTISVSDNGLGMGATQLDHLFEPFNRLGRSRSSAPGAGLGLVITRQLVEAMKGRLQVRSDPGQGSCFSIVLLCAVAAP